MMPLRGRMLFSPNPTHPSRCFAKRSNQTHICMPPDGNMRVRGRQNSKDRHNLNVASLAPHQHQTIRRAHIHCMLSVNVVLIRTLGIVYALCAGNCGWENLADWLTVTSKKNNNNHASANFYVDYKRVGVHLYKF